MFAGIFFPDGRVLCLAFSICSTLADGYCGAMLFLKTPPVKFGIAKTFRILILSFIFGSGFPSLKNFETSCGPKSTKFSGANLPNLLFTSGASHFPPLTSSNSIKFCFIL